MDRAAHHDRFPFADLVARRHGLDDLDAAFAAGRRGTLSTVEVNS